MKLFLEKGADVNLKCNEGVTAATSAILSSRRDQTTDDPTPNFLTLFSIAPDQTDRQIVALEALKFLVQNKADLTVKSDKSMSLLGFCAFTGNVPIAKFLLQNGSTPDERVNTMQWTPLLLASVAGKAKLVRYLLSLNADPNIVFPDGTSILRSAIPSGNYAIVEMLLNKKADVNAKNKEGGTALSIAKEKKLPAIVNLLKVHGAKE